MKLKFNEQGEISLYAAMLVFCIALFTILAFKLGKYGLKRVQASQHFYLCLKEYNGNLKQYIQQIENDNKILIALNAGHIPLALLTLGESVYAIEKMKDIIKAKQQMAHVSFLKNILNMQKEKCPLTPIHYKSPYSQLTSPWVLNRNPLGIVIGEKQWNLVFVNSQNRIYQKMQIKDKLFIQTYSMK